MKETPTGQERCNLLAHAYGRLPLDLRAILLEAGARRVYAKYTSFLKSLDGAIRHAQRMRDQEERQGQGIREVDWDKEPLRYPGGTVGGVPKFNTDNRKYVTRSNEEHDAADQ